ncbi:arginine N-succinyltransferase [Sphingomonas sp. 28-63-12]|uniref:arginine N-succinyltransferase n=1 Tax=Sphingomonas sp. 28-63-12 TaxID=1970434 RepID=UPI000BCCDDD8|nr:MAG: hypothetical protein B7Y47_11135 [Sphingomonas sp. 28-63-12]
MSVQSEPVARAAIRVRLTVPGDAAAVLALARKAGSGFTSLPADPDAVAARIAASQYAATSSLPTSDGQYWFVAEQISSGAILGCAAIFAQTGQPWPFYSFRRSVLHHACPELNIATQVGLLTMVNDLGGSTEVGGLLVDPAARGMQVGALLARARYMFMAASPDRFAHRVFAEMRGWQDESGTSPFWESLSGRFIPMRFAEADAYGGIHGNRFIADLLPKLPIYETMLTEQARAAIGRPHRDSARAVALLEQEGFRHDGLVDVFDAGPCMTCAFADIATIRDRRVGLAKAGGDDVPAMLIACGALVDFMATIAPGRIDGRDIDIAACHLATIGAVAGDEIAASPWQR